MMVLYYIIVGLIALLVGALAVWLVMRARVAVLKSRLQTEEADAVIKENKMTELVEQMRLQDTSIASLQTRLEFYQQQAELQKTQQAEDAQREKEREAMRQQQWEQRLKLVQEEICNSTQQILEQREQKLTDTNREQMKGVVNPLQDKLREMTTFMQSFRDLQSKNNATLGEQIRMMMERTQEIGSKADNLATALRSNDNNMQGSWGEVILSELLEREGLQKEKHFDVQPYLRDEKGTILVNEETHKKMRPDVILHYPDQKDAIIDSKVSLTAFADYFETQDEAVKTQALKRHLESVRAHVKELADKRYQDYVKPPRQSLDYVIMFVPNESALQLALQNDRSLWRDAMAAGVFITGEMTLMAVLRIVKMAWIQDAQENNQKKIMELGAMIVERVGLMTEHLDAAESTIVKAQTALADAKKKMCGGGQDILGPAQRMVKLGIKESKNHPLPTNLLEE